MKGDVKWFDDKKGYGFITPDDATADVFVHYSAILGDGRRTLQADDRVEFDVVHDQRGAHAAGVIIIQHAPAPAPSRKEFHNHARGPGRLRHLHD